MTTEDWPLSHAALRSLGVDEELFDEVEQFTVDFVRYFDKDLPLPKVFFLADHIVCLEWDFSTWDILVEIDFRNDRMDIRASEEYHRESIRIRSSSFSRVEDWLRFVRLVRYVLERAEQSQKEISMS